MTQDILGMHCPIEYLVRLNEPLVQQEVVMVASPMHMWFQACESAKLGIV